MPNKKINFLETNLDWFSSVVITKVDERSGMQDGGSTSQFLFAVFRFGGEILGQRTSS